MNTVSMTRRLPFLTLAAIAGLIAFEHADGQPGGAQPPPPAVQSSSSSAPAGAGVTITGDSDLAPKITEYVNHLTDFDIGDRGRGLARWQSPVCPLVYGSRKQGEYILWRVTQIAKEAGVPLAGDRCRHPNLFILMTTDPRKLLNDMQKKHVDVTFGGATPSAIDAFIATPRSVRTWYNTVLRTPEGLPMLKTSFPGISNAGTAAGVGGDVTIPTLPMVSDEFSTNPWAQSSHLSLNAVWAIYQVFVIIDPTRFKGVTLGQLTDYVAMSGLAQIKIDTPLGDAPTILTLFDKGPQASSAGMTDWDRSFLKSIYETEQKSILQRTEIARSMIHQIAPN